MTTKTINIGLISNDDVFCTNVTNIANDGDTPVGNVQIKVTVPEGVVYDSQSLGQGIYHENVMVWEVGTLMPNKELQGTLCWKVTDATKAPFSFGFTITAPDGCVNCNTQSFCIETSGITCANITPCVEAFIDSTPIEALSNVSNVDPQSNYVLTWNSTEQVWEPQVAQGSGAGELVQQDSGYKIADNPSISIAAGTVSLQMTGDAAITGSLYTPNNIISTTFGASGDTGTFTHAIVNGTGNIVAGIANRTIISGDQVEIPLYADINDSLIMGQGLVVGQNSGTGTDRTEVYESLVGGSTNTVGRDVFMENAIFWARSSDIGAFSPGFSVNALGALVFGSSHSIYPSNINYTFVNGLSHHIQDGIDVTYSMINGDNFDFSGGNVRSTAVFGSNIVFTDSVSYSLLSGSNLEVNGTMTNSIMFGSNYRVKQTRLGTNNTGGAVPDMDHSLTLIRDSVSLNDLPYMNASVVIGDNIESTGNEGLYRSMMFGVNMILDQGSTMFNSLSFGGTNRIGRLSGAANPVTDLRAKVDNSFIVGDNVHVNGGHPIRSIVGGEYTRITAEVAYDEALGGTTGTNVIGLDDCIIWGAGPATLNRHNQLFMMGQNCEAHSHPDTFTIDTYSFGNNQSLLDAYPVTVTAGAKARGGTLIESSGIIGSSNVELGADETSYANFSTVLNSRNVKLVNPKYTVVMGINGGAPVGVTASDITGYNLGAGTNAWSPTDNTRTEVTYLGNLHVVRTPAEVTDMTTSEILVRSTTAGDDGQVKRITAANLLSGVSGFTDTNIATDNLTVTTGGLLELNGNGLGIECTPGTGYVYMYVGDTGFDLGATLTQLYTLDAVMELGTNYGLFGHSVSAANRAIVEASGVNSTLNLQIGTATDLQINSNPGTAGQVITSQGPDLPPIWADAAGADTSLSNTNQVLTAARLVDLNDKYLEFSDSVGTNGQLSIFIGNSSIDLLPTTGGMSLAYTSAPTDTAQIDLTPNQMNLQFGTASDLALDGSAGTAGQVITSQGPGLPPVWATAGADTSIYTDNGTIADPVRTVTMNGNELIFQQSANKRVRINETGTQPMLYVVNDSHDAFEAEVTQSGDTAIVARGLGTAPSIESLHFSGAGAAVLGQAFDTGPGGLFINDAGNIALQAQVTTATGTNDVVDCMAVSRFTNGGAPADGLGVSFTLNVEDSVGIADVTSGITGSWIDPTNNAEDGRFQIFVSNNSVRENKVTVINTGAVQFNDYSSPVGLDTQTYLLGHDGQGNIVSVTDTLSIDKNLYDANGTLTSDRTVLLNGNDITFSGDATQAVSLVNISNTSTNVVSNDGVLYVNQQGTGWGAKINLDQASNTSGGLNIYSNNLASNAEGIFVNFASGTNGALPAYLRTADTVGNTVLTTLKLGVQSSGTTSSGHGLRIEFEHEDASSNQSVLGGIDYVFTDTTASSEDADIIFKTPKAGISTELLKLQGSTGAIILDGYKSGSTPTGSPMLILAVDATGKVVGEELGITKDAPFVVFDINTDVDPTSGRAIFTIPQSYNGLRLVDVTAAVQVLGSTSGAEQLLINLLRYRGAATASMLSTPVTLDVDEYYGSIGEKGSGTIDLANDDVQTGDRILPVITNNFNGSAAKGLTLFFTFAR